MDIPEPLLDEEKGLPFSHCRICELNLQEPPRPYLVEKVYKFRQNMGIKDIIFSYAICLDCAEDMRKDMSQASVEAIQQYISTHSDFRHRIESLSAGEVPRIEDYIGSCMISGKPVEDMAEYQIAGLCEGDQLIMGLWPYAIGAEVFEDLQNLLSEETLGHMDDFYGQHFGLPPEWADLFKERPLFWL